MTIEWIECPPQGVELRLEGKLDTVSAPAVRDELLKAVEGYQEITLNFEKVPYISSAGLRTLLTVQKQVGHQNGRLTLTNVVPAVMEVFRITGFSGVLNIV